MPFYEIVYEPGNRSVMFADDDEEALGALKNHHERAVKGQPGRGKSTPRTDLGDGAPQVMDYPAERIKKVFVYDKHPADYNEDMTMSADVAKSELNNWLKGKDVINLMELSGFARDLANPLKNDDEIEVHGSQYRMKETGELKLPWGDN